MGDYLWGILGVSTIARALYVGLVTVRIFRCSPPLFCLGPELHGKESRVKFTEGPTTQTTKEFSSYLEMGLKPSQYSPFF